MCAAMLGTGRKSDDGPVRAAVVDHVIPHKGDRALFFNTDNTQALQDDRDRHDAILARIPAGRWGETGDFQGPAVFLASRASDYMHGTIVTVDGGWMGR